MSHKDAYFTDFDYYDSNDRNQIRSPNTREETRNIDEKVFFAVLDITDGRRYKVFLRQSDIPRLKVGKIRKTLSAVSGKPPFSFDLWHGDMLLLDMESANCADLGITPQTMLVMRPSEKGRSSNVEETKEQKQEEKFMGNTAGSSEEVINDDVFPVGFLEKHTHDVVKEFTSIGNESAFVVELNERQRMLQAQLYEEAKRSNLFSILSSNGKKKSPNSNNNNNNNNNSDGAILRNAVIDNVLQSEEALSDEIIPEQNSNNNDDSFTDFIQEIVNNKITHPVSDTVTTSMPSQDASHTIGVTHSTNSLENNNTASLDLMMQGGRYYDMYCEGDNHNNGFFSSPVTSTEVYSQRNNNNESREKTQNECEEQERRPERGLPSHPILMMNTNTGIMRSTVSDREKQLTQLVQNLQDDVSELLALQVRGETTKRALQHALAASQQHVRRLQGREEELQLQMEALLAVLRRGPNGQFQPLTEAELRTAVEHTTALYHSEVLRRENTALERRLAQEVRRRRDMALTLEDMKGHIRVLVRVRPPMRVLVQHGQDNATGEIESTARTTTTSSSSEPVVGVMVADGQRNIVTITDPYAEPRQFHFYRVFTVGSTQAEVFSEVAPLVQLACDGVNVSVLAYGQTGSGKTYTIFGPEQQGNTTINEKHARKNNNNRYDDDNDVVEEEEEEDEIEAEDDGIVPRTIRVLFQHLRAEAASEMALMSQHGKNNNNSNSNKNSDVADKDKGDEEVDLSRSSMFEVSCSLVEMYNDKVRDLLAPPQLVVPTFHVGGNNNNNNNSKSNNTITTNNNTKGEGVEHRGPISVAPQRTVRVDPDGHMYVVGLTQHVVRNAGEALRVLRDGATRRQVQATQQNSSSSRSHMIFTVHLSQRRRVPSQRSNSNSGKNKNNHIPGSSVAYKRLESKLVFVDLAGSERIAKSQSTGDRLQEARYINKSLAALGDVVATLSNSTTTTGTTSTSTGSGGATHVPYRNSMLTALLQDVIGSRSKTVLLACVAPSDPPYENHTAETATTLQFASRVRCVRNFAPPFHTSNFSSIPSQSQSQQQPAAASTTTTTTTTNTNNNTNANTNTITGGGGSTKHPNTNMAETDMDSSHGLSAVGRGVTKLWMRPTESSRLRVNAAGRQNATTTKSTKTPSETERTEEIGRTQLPTPQQQRVAGDSNIETRPRMRF